MSAQCVCTMHDVSHLVKGCMHVRCSRGHLQCELSARPALGQGCRLQGLRGVDKAITQGHGGGDDAPDDDACAQGSLGT